MKENLIFFGDDELLEGPVFDHDNKILYFVSILNQLVYRYDPLNKTILSIKLNSVVGCLFLDEPDIIVAACKDGFFKVNFKTLKSELLFKITLPKNVRFNDGIKDAKGRWLVGTMGYPEVVEGIGEVFSIENHHSKSIIKKTTISNGIAFSSNSEWMYFIDTPTKKVVRYNYNVETGSLANPIVCIDFDSRGFPDGMCMDKEGNLWIAEWGGYCVSQWNPDTGKKINAIQLPCPNVSSCCFDHLGGMYVTTAKSDIKDNNLGGGLFYFDNQNFL